MTGVRILAWGTNDIHTEKWMTKKQRKKLRKKIEKQMRKLKEGCPPGWSISHHVIFNRGKKG